MLEVRRATGRMKTAVAFGLLSRRRVVRLLPLVVRPLGVSLSTVAAGGRGGRGSKAAGGRGSKGSKASEDEEALRALTNMLNAVTASGFPPPTATCDADADADDDDDDPPVEQPTKRRRLRARNDSTRSSLMRKTSDTLEQMCEDAGLPSTGSKAQMVEHLLTRRPAAARPARLTAAMLGVGGLEAAVAELDTRVWLPHVAPAAAATRLDVTPPIGVLLYGPPGCGKSHLAVALAHAISPSRSPKIVKGPELKGALWGQDEHAVRDLFEEEDEEGRMDGVEGGAEAVRVVILDEAESLLSSRELNGSSAKHYNSSVTQFLSCLDGAAERQAERGAGRPRRRLLLLALTNRREMLDAALLRPGRFEVQIELPLPDEAGRAAILQLLTAHLEQSGALEPAALADRAMLARSSVGLSGADLGGVVREAKSAALRRFCEAAELASASASTSVSASASASTSASASAVVDAALRTLPSRPDAIAALRAEAATVTRAELRAALRAELTRRAERGEPCTPVHVLDSEAKAADLAAELSAGLPQPR
jgi:ATP-dependent 26S proteasome regulatory subunit